MDIGSANVPDKELAKAADGDVSSSVEHQPADSAGDAQSKISAWAKNLKLPQSFVGSQDESLPGNTGQSTFARLTSGIGLRSSPKSPISGENSIVTSPTSPSGFIGTLTKGIVDSSKSAVKAVQVKARHAVSQNKRRYQEGEFDLDLTYITENIIAMGFPAGDMSSGIFGYFEGLYRNHMEEVIKFLETRHKDKYKVYNLCSERLYDASLFEGKVASFPFDDHNCPPLQLTTLFCQSAYSWLKEDIENVVVVHCKAGMARTGLMISSLLLYLKVMLDHMMPLVDDSWRVKFERVREDGFSRLQGFWVLREIVLPIIMKLLTALCVPYVLARGVFPVFGYPLVINSAVYRFAWLGCLCFSSLLYSAKRFHVWFTNLHNSIRDDRYLIGRRLHNFGEDREQRRQRELLIYESSNGDSTDDVQHDQEAADLGLRHRHFVQQEA